MYSSYSASPFVNWAYHGRCPPASDDVVATASSLFLDEGDGRNLVVAASRRVAFRAFLTWVVGQTLGPLASCLFGDVSSSFRAVGAIFLSVLFSLVRFCLGVVAWSGVVVLSDAPSTAEGPYRVESGGASGSPVIVIPLLVSPLDVDDDDDDAPPEAEDENAPKVVLDLRVVTILTVALDDVDFVDVVAVGVRPEKPKTENWL
jgi:hypothetical protein